MSYTQQAIDDFHQVRTSDDFDLISFVRNLLIQAGLQSQVEQHFDTSQHIIDGTNKKPEIQRFLLNRYWNLQLMNCKSVSINERYCLIANGSIEDWTRLFTSAILPFLINNKLPKSLQD